MRGLTRPTNAFSRKLENHIHAPALYFPSYTSAAFIGRCACRPLWQRGSLNGCGRSRRSSLSLMKWPRHLSRADRTGSGVTRVNIIPPIVFVIWGSVVAGMLFYIASTLSAIARHLRDRS
jgi:hypothetical protein